MKTTQLSGLFASLGLGAIIGVNGWEVKREPWGASQTSNWGSGGSGGGQWARRDDGIHRTLDLVFIRNSSNAVCARNSLAMVVQQHGAASVAARSHFGSVDLDECTIRRLLLESILLLFDADRAASASTSESNTTPPPTPQGATSGSWSYISAPSVGRGIFVVMDIFLFSPKSEATRGSARRFGVDLLNIQHDPASHSSDRIPVWLVEVDFGTFSYFWSWISSPPQKLPDVPQGGSAWIYSPSNTKPPTPPAGSTAGSWRDSVGFLGLINYSASSSIWSNSRLWHLEMDKFSYGQWLFLVLDRFFLTAAASTSSCGGYSLGLVVLEYAISSPSFWSNKRLMEVGLKPNTRVGLLLELVRGTEIRSPQAASAQNNEIPSHPNLDHGQSGQESPSQHGTIPVQPPHGNTGGSFEQPLNPSQGSNPQVPVKPADSGTGGSIDQPLNPNQGFHPQVQPPFTSEHGAVPVQPTQPNSSGSGGSFPQENSHSSGGIAGPKIPDHGSIPLPIDPLTGLPYGGVTPSHGNTGGTFDNGGSPITPHVEPALPHTGDTGSVPGPNQGTSGGNPGLAHPLAGQTWIQVPTIWTESCVKSVFDALHCTSCSQCQR
ncbi:hypothetical protein B2J93_4714 [Marssonina coronariae]|uniref:Uncharacterized protein n=1 Tax=Diplocarpon coronariae TaxID=2795749 RepID=A0A218Z2F3_9HELO|nr:hypothetical protein B2J93_4714 [Marssonina coronariae]